MKKIRPAFKCYNGKYYLCDWIISNFPQDYQEYTYVEPYCGGANVFFNKLPSKKEIISDISLGIIQIYRCIRNNLEEFTEKIKEVEYSKDFFHKEQERTNFENNLDHAVNEYVLRRMSRDGNKKKFCWNKRIRGGKPGEVNAWHTSIKNLPRISKRLKEVHIVNEKAIDVIKTFNTEKTLLYLDPPNVPKKSKKFRICEMSEQDHVDLSKAIINYKGKVLLSGYESSLYSSLYQNWNIIRKEKKKQVLWRNF